MPDVARAALDAAIAATSASADAAPASITRKAAGPADTTRAASATNTPAAADMSPALARVFAAVRAAQTAETASGQAPAAAGAVPAGSSAFIDNGTGQGAAAVPQASSAAVSPSLAAAVAATTAGSPSGAPAGKTADASSHAASDRSDLPAAGMPAVGHSALAAAAAQAGLLAGPAPNAGGGLVFDAAPLDHPLPSPAEGTADQIVQTMRLQAVDGGGVAEIRLQPEQFGQLTISIHVADGQVSARLQTDSPAARDWLQSNADALRHGLSTHDLTLDRLEIAEPPSTPSPSDRRGSGDRAFREQPPPRRQSRRTPSGAGETFELIA
jgi:flagellar hook-length control protein FliK